jgi:hypothetical protein
VRSRRWSSRSGASSSCSEVDEITFFADPALPARFGLPEHV